MKELNLSEGHSSGISTIQKELQKNGSPRAEFFTDEDRRAMRIRIPIYPAFLNMQEGTEKTKTSFETSMKQVLKPKDFRKLKLVIGELTKKDEITIQEVMAITKKSRTTAWRYMQILVDLGAVGAEGNTNNMIYRVKG